jgi:hypothetical protein
MVCLNSPYRPLSSILFCRSRLDLSVRTTGLFQDHTIMIMSGASQPSTSGTCTGSPYGKWCIAVLAALCSLVSPWPPVCGAADLAELEEMIDEARLTFARFTGHPNMSWFRDRARNARAVFIAPRVTDLAPLNGSRSSGRVGPKGGRYATSASHRRTNSQQTA